ncbi:MAG TPA: hypothetical protein VF120_08680, partial [Ktedonobacterales bacterium]
PIMEGRLMSMILSKAPNWEPQKKAAPAPRERKNSARGAAESDDGVDESVDESADEHEQPSVATEQVAPEVMATPDTVGQPGTNTTLGVESAEDSAATEQ